MNKKRLYIACGVIILVFVLLIWHFAPVIQRWLAGVFVDIVVLLLTFAAGWCFGRYGRRRSADKAGR